MRIAGDENAISPHLRWEVFVIVVAHGGRAKAEALLSLWKTSSNSDERYLALECLGRASDASLVKWILGLVFTEDIKDQDIYLLLWLMGSSAHGTTELWEWAKLNWGRLEDVKTYFSGCDTRQYEQALAQKLERIETRVRWAARDVGNVAPWLKTHGYLEECQWSN
ncbi:hypothetical protein CHGG_01141 [Chaetomium globosum CBS 148.51]|uniref:ERAP1-like C-terminal domain-containing protein n=1 Tax=Chaetomium globosum (strain ATCC 6205 / CBS 148.51 / DSM 1962 / NBRC 6347 / NRRL 1970) TaxID=306901 RepID=Q2HF63_CHAGB|nr:uncharacterized protein CHGG_01141 [Chaetomium globosum CBS 148.51]EAQ92906.1 hypothetical protein CHGG_01141 [Chaetomium globosum CBS 148.51]